MHSATAQSALRPSGTLRFRRWSRRRYAAFVSVQRAVTIGQLSAHVADRFQVKQGTLHALANQNNKNYPATEEEELALSAEQLLLLTGLQPVEATNLPALPADSIRTRIKQIRRIHTD